MKRTRLLTGWIAAFLICCFAISAYAADLITPGELEKIMDNENVIVVSARSAKDYKKIHIKNAVHVDLEDLYKSGDVKGLLKSPDEIATILGSKGISESKTIVLYCNKSVNAGRLYWILKYLGANDVKILDGQLKAWRKARKSVTKEVPEVAAATFTPKVNSAIIVDMKYVQSHRTDAGVVLVDARDKEEFDGTKGETARKGHIPGAIHFEYKNILNDDSTVKSKADILSAAKGAGITSDKEVILYCETSGRTGIVFMALTSIAGYTNVKVYDGAFYEWSADASNPVE